jgi:hypothetical protein
MAYPHAVILSEAGRASRGPRVEGPAVAFAFAVRTFIQPKFRGTPVFESEM